jgi:hypothetical protein
LRTLVPAASMLLIACGQDFGRAPSIEYYRSHPAEWERAVWVCTNEPATLEHTPACVTALEALRTHKGLRIRPERQLAALPPALPASDR